MPICIPNDLPAKQLLVSEGIIVMEEGRAQTQDIRPLSFLLLNLMPKKEETETQILRLLGNSPIQMTIDFLQMSTHRAKNTSESYLKKFYVEFQHIKDKFYDGMIITGAPVEQLAFEQVNYWDELCQIFEWSRTHVFSTLHICWGAQARLYADYGIEKYTLPAKVFGVYNHRLNNPHHPLTRGFNDCFLAPHSRHTAIEEEKLAHIDNLEVLASSEVGSLLLATKDLRAIFLTGHIEYDACTLHNEYMRDREKGLEIAEPVHYYLNGDCTTMPIQTWRATAHLFYHNWINEVYQRTPYVLTEMPSVPFGKNSSV